MCLAISAVISAGTTSISTPKAPAYFTADQIETLEAEREQSRVGTADQLRVFAEQQVRRTVHVVVEEGLPEDALVRMAADFDLIVVGTPHGPDRPVHAS